VEASLYGFISPGTCEDALYVFKTISLEEIETRAILMQARAEARARRKQYDAAMSPTNKSNLAEMSTVSSTGSPEPV
jgi:hypothetical protein